MNERNKELAKAVQTAAGILFSLDNERERLATFLEEVVALIPKEHHKIIARLHYQIDTLREEPYEF